MLDGELFRQGRLEMSSAPLPELQTPAEWNDLLPNKIAIVLSVVLVLIYLKDIIRLIPPLLYALDRKRGGESLEYNVSAARMRNTVALIYTLPFCLIADYCGAYRPGFWSMVPPEWSSAATLGVMLAYFLLRRLCYAAIRPGKMSAESLATLKHSLYNYFIALVSVAVPTIGILPLFSVREDIIRTVFLALTGLAFAFATVRAWQILKSRRSPLPTILYLCGLEILPAAAVVASAVLL